MSDKNGNGLGPRAEALMRSLYDTRADAFRMRIGSIHSEEPRPDATDRAIKLAEDFTRQSKRGQVHMFLIVAETMFTLMDRFDE